jgi:hypothetical protein
MNPTSNVFSVHCNNTMLPQSSQALKIVKNLTFLFSSLTNPYSEPFFFYSLKSYLFHQKSDAYFQNIVNSVGQYALSLRATFLENELHAIRISYMLSIEACKTEILYNTIKVNTKDFELFEKELHKFEDSLFETTLELRNMKTDLPFLVEFDNFIEKFNEEIIEQISDLKGLMRLAYQAKMNWIEYLPAEALAKIYGFLPIKDLINFESSSKTLYSSIATLYFNMDFSEMICNELDVIKNRLKLRKDENPISTEEAKENKRTIKIIKRKINFLNHHCKDVAHHSSVELL